MKRFFISAGVLTHELTLDFVLAMGLTVAGSSLVVSLATWRL